MVINRLFDVEAGGGKVRGTVKSSGSKFTPDEKDFKMRLTDCG